jgi:AcrR family transcriptional regulator
MKPIPTDDYRRFQRDVNALKESCYLDFFSENPATFQIKKEKTISKNLERIFAAALKISNQKGFHAMSMRDLSKAAHLSIGALYNYFSGKDELLEMLQRHRRTISVQVLQANIDVHKKPLDKLRTAIRTHLYLSEAMQAWFYFAYMEAKNINSKEKKAAVEGELKTEQMLTDIITTGRDQGIFATNDCQVAAGLIKAMLQDWYLKHAKHTRRGLDVETYARSMITFVENSLVNQDAAGQGER